MNKITAQSILWEEFREYTEDNEISRYERKLLKDWVRSGHSVYETVESRYMTSPSYPSMDFLEAYRLDCELKEDMRNMTRAEKTAYLKACMGWEDNTSEETAMYDAKKETPKLIEEHVRRLERELFNLWTYVYQEGLGDDAREFVEEHRNEPIPFEW